MRIKEFLFWVIDKQSVKKLWPNCPPVNYRGLYELAETTAP
jgi:hypothetical protein